MGKEAISLGNILVNVNILPDNMLDVSITTPERGTIHYAQITAEQAGMNVQELIGDMADTALEGTGRHLTEPFHARNLHGADLRQIFERYIERKRYLTQHPVGTADASIYEGACKEAEVWLQKCGYSLDDERITDLINGDRQIYRQESDSLYRTDRDFLVISAEPFFLCGIKGYLVGWSHDNDTWGNRISSQLLFVPELSVWSDAAKNNVVTAKSLPGYPRRFRYMIAAMDGPKVLLHSNTTTENGTTTESGKWESLGSFSMMYMDMYDLINSWQRNIDDSKLSKDSLKALHTIIGK